jgi:hypothetical protein
MSDITPFYNTFRSAYFDLRSPFLLDYFFWILRIWVSWVQLQEILMRLSDILSNTHIIIWRE